MYLGRMRRKDGATMPKFLRRRRARPGFTMIELLTSLTVMSVLMFAMAAAVVVATGALPDVNNPVLRVSQTSPVLGEMADELQAAIYLTERTPTAVTFSVADRDGDGLPEVIRYAWSGTIGDPLTRRYNGSSPATVLESIDALDLSYETRSATETYPGPVVEGSEIEVSSHPVAGDPKNFLIESDLWVGQYFKPTLPPDTTSWRLTRALFMARKDGAASGETLVQVRTAAADKLPTATILEQVSMLESGLPASHLWQTFNFTTVSGLSPADGLCLVLAHQSGGTAAGVRSDDSGFERLITTDGGAGWNLDSGKSLVYFAYGKAMTQTAPQTLTREYVTAVRAVLQADTAVATRAETLILMLNAPEVLTAVWDVDFEADPTKMDLDADGVGDWRMKDAGAFDTGQLTGGVFWADDELHTSPDSDFVEPITVDLSFRDISDDGEAGGVLMRVDRTVNTYAFIRAEMERGGGGTQTLTISTFDEGLAFVPIVVESGLPIEFVDLRLLVDPGADTVHVRLEGNDRGTYRYGRITALTPRVIGLYETDDPSGIQFDSVRIRVGGTGS